MITYDEYAEIRDSKGLTDGKVAKKAGIGRSTFSDWKYGRSVPKFDKMCKIAEAMGMVYLELVDMDGNNSSVNTLLPKDRDQFVDDPRQAKSTMAEATPEQIAAALRMYQAYQESLPEIQSAVDSLIGPHLPHS